jgi:hypothetical protein
VLKILEGSAKGCERLIGEWKALADRLEKGRAWQPYDRLKAICLMGKQSVDAVGDDRVPRGSSGGSVPEVEGM